MRVGKRGEGGRGGECATVTTIFTDSRHTILLKQEVTNMASEGSDNLYEKWYRKAMFLRNASSGSPPGRLAGVNVVKSGISGLFVKSTYNFEECNLPFLNESQNRSLRNHGDIPTGNN